MKKAYIFIIMTVALLCFISTTYASVINAKSCGASEVQNAINSAVDGDTVTIPAGNCSWTTKININCSSRSINVQGAGENLTLINHGVTSGPLWGITTGKGKICKIGNMKFIGALANAKSQADVSGNAGSNSFRIHHITWDASGLSNSNGPMFYVYGDNWGVFDHISATATRVGFININGGPTGSNSMDGVRTNFGPNSTLFPGTRDAVYVEDSTITMNGYIAGAATMDGQNGARYVFRNNTVNNGYTGGHGPDSGYFGITLQEVYNNTFNITVGGPNSFDKVFHARSGIMIYHNNTVNVSDTLSWSATGIYIDMFRANNGFHPKYKYDCSPIEQNLKFCSQLNSDWSLSGTVSNIDCKTDTDCGTGTCKWKLCSNSMTLCGSDGDCPLSETCSRYVDGGPTGNGGNLCFNSVSAGKNNLRVPSYEWENYYNYKGTIKGNMNFSAPASVMTVGVDYFNDTKMPNYSPYTYPHPLQQQLGTIPTDKTPLFPAQININ